MSHGTVAPGSQASLREANSARILDAVKSFGRITQVELAGATGLSAATVSNIVKQLAEQGVLDTSATVRSGRRAQLVTLATTSALAVGLHITRRSLQLVIGDASLEVRAGKRLPLPLDHRSDTTLDRAALLVAELAEEVGADLDKVDAIGLALPRRLAPRGAPGHPSLPGWADLDVERLLSARLSRPVLVLDVAPAAALAEVRLGGLRGVDRGLYVHAGHATESAVVVGGAVIGGLTGAMGALDHVRMDPAGPICRCGARGCLATAVSAEALAEPLRLSHGPMDLRAIVKAVRDGAPGPRQVVADAGALIGQAVADLATVVAPDRVVLGGELAGAGEPFVGAVREALRTRPLLPDPDLLFAESAFGGDGPARGALVAAQDGISLAPSQGMEG